MTAISIRRVSRINALSDDSGQSACGEPSWSKLESSLVRNMTEHTCVYTFPSPRSRVTQLSPTDFCHMSKNKLSSSASSSSRHQFPCTTDHSHVVCKFLHPLTLSVCIYTVVYPVWLCNSIYSRFFRYFSVINSGLFMAMGWRACSASQRGELEKKDKCLSLVSRERFGKLYNIGMRASETQQALVGLGFVMQWPPTCRACVLLRWKASFSLRKSFALLARSGRANLGSAAQTTC